MTDSTPAAVDDAFKELASTAGDTKVAPAQGIAAIALSMAMKYHNMNTVQDGTLYQQYKLEGRNLEPLHLDMVLDTATRIETWLLGASDRIAKVIVDALVLTTDEAGGAPAEEAQSSTERGEANPSQEPTHER